MQNPLHIDPQQAFNEIANFQRKLAAGLQNLRGLGAKPSIAKTSSRSGI
jgi:polyhydroxyalkanoate synthase subunit PhaC